MQPTAIDAILALNHTHSHASHSLTQSHALARITPHSLPPTHTLSRLSLTLSKHEPSLSHPLNIQALSEEKISFIVC